jgi:hypothetical protein
MGRKVGLRVGIFGAAVFITALAMAHAATKGTWIP